MPAYYPPGSSASAGGGGGGGGGFGGGERDRRHMDFYPYFLDGDGMEQAVIHMDLPRYLGPNAISRPGLYEVMFYIV